MIWLFPLLELQALSFAIEQRGWVVDTVESILELNLKIHWSALTEAPGIDLAAVTCVLWLGVEAQIISHILMMRHTGFLYKFYNHAILQSPTVKFSAPIIKYPRCGDRLYTLQEPSSDPNLYGGLKCADRLVALVE